MSDEGEKDDASENTADKKPGKSFGALIALAAGLYFLSQSFWLIYREEWPIWSDDRLRLLFSVFYLFGKKIGVYGAAALTGLLGVGCIVGAAATVLERRKNDKKRDK